ncbi:hypothetical protein BST81_09630 [Leptolyngbya sp. 'hensonii']|nr:hypothetical protein BST81_09630 [Leptolyngbya sp. 'hensonii']
MQYGASAPNRSLAVNLPLLSGIEGKFQAEVPETLSHSVDHPTRSAPQQKSPLDYPSFNSDQFDQQLQRYRQYLAEQGRPDILIVGSSRAAMGVDPLALQRGLFIRGYPQLKIFNFGINGATAQVVDLLLREILTPDQLPNLILWADGVRAFNAGRPDFTYGKMVTSPGYRQLAVAPPKPLQAAPSPQNCLETSSGYVASQVAPRPLTALWLSVLLNPQFVTNPSCSHWSQSLELLTYNSIRASQEDLKSLERLGFYPVSERFNPHIYYRKYPRVAGIYDGDYQDFNLWGEQMEATARIVRFVRQQQIPLIYVNLPLTRDYMDGARSTYEREFRQFIQELARTEGFIFRDLNRPPLVRNEYFLDPSHLNRFGAYAVAADLAQDTTLPWPRLMKPETPIGQRPLPWALALSQLHRGFKLIKL